jgi:hypothetical protein
MSVCLYVVSIAVEVCLIMPRSYTHLAGNLFVAVFVPDGKSISSGYLNVILWIADVGLVLSDKA